MIVLELPYPPSVNSYYRHVGNKTLISREGRLFRAKVVSILAIEEIKQMEGPIQVAICLRTPDRRRRDVDNVLKSLLDALQHGGAYEDDSQIQRLSIWKGEPKPPNGCALVEIERL